MARVRRRTWFSTPLVIVLGCGHPQEPNPAHEPARTASGVVDATASQAIEAVAEEPVQGSAPCVGHCNPPGLPGIIDGGRIVDIKVVDGKRELEIALGDHVDATQITTQWTAVLGLGGHLVRGGKLVIVTSWQHYVRATLASDLERPEQYRVRFYPPGMQP